MFISSLRKPGIPVFYKPIALLAISLVLTLCLMLRFVSVAAPFVENKARYIAIDIINATVSSYISKNEEVFSNMVQISSSEGSVYSATVDTAKLNIIKAELTEQINTTLSNDNTYVVKIPLSNLLGIPLLTGTSSGLKIKMHPVSRVLADLEKSFISTGINQTMLSLNLKIQVTIQVIIPGIRRSVKVETDIPLGDSVFLGDVPGYYSTTGNPPFVTYNQ